MEPFGLILWVFQSEDGFVSSLPCSVVLEAELLCAKGSWASGRPLVALPLPVCSHCCSRGQIKVIHSQTEALIIHCKFSLCVDVYHGDTDLHVGP